MRYLLTITFLLSCFIVNSQYVLKGAVTNQYDEGIPGVRIYVKNTTYGVITNQNGEYFIEFDKKQTYLINYRAIGFSDTTYHVEVSKSINIFDVKLKEEAIELREVEIYADKIDVAKKVIKATNKQKKYWKNHIEQYKCDTYIKTSLEKDLKPFYAQRLLKKADTVLGGPSKMNFIESYSITKFKQPKKYSEKIIAYHDYTEKSNSNVNVSVSGGETYGQPDVAPNQPVRHNPYVFYEKVQDGNFNLYQNLIKLPSITTQPILSPIADGAFASYKYNLQNIFYEDGYKIYSIEVIPRNEFAPLFSGTIFIIDSLWIIKSFDLKINENTMDYFKTFQIIQDYDKVNDKWVVERREFNYSISDGKYIVSANTRVKHSNYDFNPQFNKKDFGDAVLVYDEMAYEKDSVYWDSLRPISLKQEELSFIHKQDSVTKFLESEAYLDSVDQEFNKISFWDVTLNGIGFRNRFKKQEFYINSLLASAKIFGVGGFRYGLGGSYKKEFKNAHKIKVSGEANYGFNNKDVKGFLSVSYTYLPLRFGKLTVSGGDIYDMINNYESVVGTFSRSNYVRNQYFGVSQRIEIVNGLYGRLAFDYSTKHEITDLKLTSWSDAVFGSLNTPQPFETYTVSMFELNLVYRFHQKYVIKKGKKIIIGSKFPELKLTYKKGVPKLFGSDVNFDFIEVRVSDNVKLARLGELKWNAIAGSFVNQVDLRFIEHKFFRGSDNFFFSNPLQSHQMLDSTFHTSLPYFQAFGIHHFNGFIMNKIPIIKHLKLELVVGASALLIQEENYSHAELFAGVERKIKIKKQLFKIGVYTAVRDNNITSTAFRFKIGLDFFNSYTNQWSY